MKIERTFSKDKILELYLNEIYLGLGAYGVAAASLMYFDKSVHELTLAEAAYLAALPKAPNNYHPFRQRERAIERRNYVIDRMVEDDYITADEGEKAKKEPLNVTPRPTGAHIFAAEYFAEEVRRDIYENYGEKKLYEGGLSVRTTLDPKMQVLARKVLIDGLVQFRRAAGLSRRRSARSTSRATGACKLADVKALADVAPWRLAVVLESERPAARIGFQPAREPGGAVSKRARDRHRSARRREMGEADERPDARARRRPRSSQVLKSATSSMSSRSPARTASSACARCPRSPARIVAMDPHTGRVLAMVGGFSYDQSQFNRATQALRQPGSSFKPFVYAAALDNGYTPSIGRDGRADRDRSGPAAASGRRRTIEGKFYGPSTLRFGIEQSRNVMTVRLAQDIGMPLIAEYAKRFGVYDNLPPYLSLALGAGETTLLRMVGAYAMFANGGRKITPTLIDRIQDRYGHTIYKHDQRECRGCDADKWAEPGRADADRQARAGARPDDRLPDHLDDGRRGAARHRHRGARRSASRSPARPAPPTTRRTPGSSASRPTSWSASIIGYDKPRHLGRGATGGVLAAPIVRGFHEDRARRQAGGAVPRAGRHQAHPHRSQDRHARRARRPARDPGSLQARHRAARQLFGDRRDRRRRPAARVSPEADRGVRTGSGLY